MGEGIVRVFEIDLYTLLYLKWITNKDLLDSTWNSTQCYVPTWKDIRFEGRRDSCICMVESLSCSPESSPVSPTLPVIGSL